jgi:hypothetical protein
MLENSKKAWISVNVDFIKTGFLDSTASILRIPRKGCTVISQEEPGCRRMKHDFGRVANNDCAARRQHTSVQMAATNVYCPEMNQSYQ